MLIWSFNTLNARHAAANGGAGTIATYDDLAHHVLGRWGCVAVRLLTLCETHGGCLCFTVLHMTSWPALLNHAPDDTVAFLGGVVQLRTLVACLVCLLAFPTTLVTPEVLSRFSSVGLLATCTLVLCMLVTPFLDPDTPLPAGAACPEVTTRIRIAGEDDAPPVMGIDDVRLSGAGLSLGIGATRSANPNPESDKQPVSAAPVLRRASL